LPRKYIYSILFYSILQGYPAHVSTLGGRKGRGKEVRGKRRAGKGRGKKERVGKGE
jgi:hypothetical protein